MVAKPVAQEIVTFVGAVGDEIQAPLGAESLHLLPCDGQHGPDHISADRGNASQALQTGAPD